MARKLRNLQTDMVYHVVCKGNNGEYVFGKDEDKWMFVKILKKYRLKYDFELYAYCIMDNHVHLLIKMGETMLSRVMQGISQSFTQKFNRKYERSGHVFGGRYFSSECETTQSTMAAMAYIHLNPFKAGKTKGLDYAWSSHFAYSKGLVKVWFDNVGLLKRFKDKLQSAKEIYLEHLEQFKSDPVFFEYSEKDVMAEPMTLDRLLAKLRVNRRFRSLEYLFEKERAAESTDGCGRIERLVWHKLIWINDRFRLVSCAELARRLDVKRTLVLRAVRELRKKGSALEEDDRIMLDNEVKRYLNMNDSQNLNAVEHKENLDQVMLEAEGFLEGF
ncbi:transposase [Acidaminobacter hydrogenoformans]|uniref:REP element-mobilizing transposase RayT n=1 Tax=Acidaminobacter hydrogenoformans DSM 2784 TaxID=1120920 RepID=A0A1G5RWA9_9FIRM|nr:transposase [Acidaminobacter hydrogenoformans]SCZ78402.1 REP element-mobilizing transposase RayT [Acidaminobacter hydrogenoformans DSM 2784]